MLLIWTYILLIQKVKQEILAIIPTSAHLTTKQDINLEIIDETNVLNDDITIRVYVVDERRIKEITSDEALSYTIIDTVK